MIKKLLKSIIRNIKIKEIIPIEHMVENNNLLKDKVALITGGSGGIGFAIARSYVESGCKVILVGTNEMKLKELVEKLGNNFAKYIKVDLYNIKKFNEIVEKAVNLFGKIDILVCSAGKHIVKENLCFIETREEEYDQIMNLNLKSTYFFIQSVTKYMIAKKIKGHVLIISSQSALEPAWSPYRLSKWGIKGITCGIAQELLQYGIIVNAIGPGPTATSMQPYKEGDSIYTEGNTIKRYTMPDEIATYAKLLVSNLGDMIVGDTLYMSGGRGIVEIR